ncbi:MAG: energy-coupling factor transporter ATPase [Lactobacillales bacterium]|jgi:energy-coupling factor transport system ATP-binding protein|nr:energy-coupling factor transporter ATPase [Lactobacillales bacterium]
MDIIFKNVSYTYQVGSPFETTALDDVSLEINGGQVTAIIGHTGSGKSTLLRHLNALSIPTAGELKIGDLVITPKSKEKEVSALRKNIGVVFQFPEAQLFEQTVEKDIMFGPKNFGVSVEEAKKIAREVILAVGLDESYLEKSPFDLSGGEKRRVAIAGVLAMEPKLLVLDEPTAGLDPRGQREVMEMFMRLHKEKGIGIIMVTHNMDDVANYADTVVAMSQARVLFHDETINLIEREEELRTHSLELPFTLKFYKELKEMGMPIYEPRLSIEGLAREIKGVVENG